MRKFDTLIAAGLVIAAWSTHAQAVPIVVGTKIGIDIGNTPTTNWNNFNNNLTDNSITDLSGATLTGVTIATSNGQFYNGDGTNNWGGLATNGGPAPPEFVDSVVTDIGGNFNLGDGSPFTVTITGLNTSLTYNVYAVTTAGFAPIDTVTVTGASTYGPSAISRPSTLASPWPFHTFLGVTPTGSGDLTITVVDTNTSANPILNGVLLHAVPEPSSFAMLLFGSAFLWLIRRKRSIV